MHRFRVCFYGFGVRGSGIGGLMCVRLGWQPRFKEIRGCRRFAAGAMDPEACGEAAPDPNEDVLLFGFGGAFVLFNCLSGDLRRLPHAGPYELCTGADGALSLKPGLRGAAETPVAEIMQLKLSSDEGSTFVMRAGRPPETLVECRKRYATIAISIDISGHDVGLTKLRCETYHFMSTSIRWTVFWVFGFITDALGVTESKHIRCASLVGPWRTKVADFLVWVCNEEELAEHHCRQSSRVVQAKARLGTANELNVFDSPEPDNSCSTFAVLVVVVFYACKGAHGRRSTKCNQADIKARSELMSARACQDVHRWRC